VPVQACTPLNAHSMLETGVARCALPAPLLLSCYAPTPTASLKWPRARARESPP
jgi:hypothetical protein